MPAARMTLTCGERGLHRWHMKIVATNSVADIARAGAELAIKRAIRKLAANTLRVIGGAGKPAELPAMAADFIQAISAYMEAAGHPPSGALLASFLDLKAARLEYRPWAADFVPSPEDSELEDVKQLMQKAVLQIVASDLVNQISQRNKASGDHSAALFAWEKIMVDVRAKSRIAGLNNGAHRR